MGLSRGRGWGGFPGHQPCDWPLNPRSRGPRDRRTRGMGRVLPKPWEAPPCERRAALGGRRRVWQDGRWARVQGSDLQGTRGEGVGSGKGHQRCHMGVTSWCSKGPLEVRPRCGLRCGAGAARGPGEDCRGGAGRVRGRARERPAGEDTSPEKCPELQGKSSLSPEELCILCGDSREGDVTVTVCSQLKLTVRN